MSQRYMDRLDNRWATYGLLAGFALNVAVLAAVWLVVGSDVAGLVGLAVSLPLQLGGFWLGGALAWRRVNRVQAEQGIDAAMLALNRER